MRTTFQIVKYSTVSEPVVMYKGYTRAEEAMEEVENMIFADAKKFMHEGLDEVKIYYTSDERYPDAWGLGNNGIEIAYNAQKYGYIIEEERK